MIIKPFFEFIGRFIIWESLQLIGSKTFDLSYNWLYFFMAIGGLIWVILPLFSGGKRCSSVVK